MKEAASNTLEEYDAVIAKCRDIFSKKLRDYHSAWRILRLSSITDQIYIKALRIRSIEEKGAKKVSDTIEDEFIGIINYSIIALIQKERNQSMEEIMHDDCLILFDKHVANTKALMEAKNHDYGEAWRGMRLSSMTDLILMKLLRVKQIEDNKGASIESEGVEANYADMANYAIFALIKMGAI